jgi:glycosyltransferase involved in cell wall biosynthesis
MTSVPRPSDAPTATSARRQRVLVLNWRDPWHPEAGGSELYMEQVLTRLAARGFDVVVFTARYTGSTAQEVRDGIHYIRRGGHLTVYLWAMFLLLTRRFGRVDRVLEVQNGMPFLSRLATNAPVTVLVHHVHREQWPVVGPVLARIGWFMESRAAVRVNRGCRYLAVSDVTRNELIELGVRAEDIAIAYNGLPPIAEVRGVERSPEPRLVVLSRLVPHKQIEHAIEILPALRTELPGTTLHVLGSGWWYDQLVERRDELGLGDAVVFHGHVSETEKFEELERAWVHVLPSIKEGWGLSIIEAAAVGTPSVAYRSAGGVQESILDGVTGLLAADHADLASKVRTLLIDDDLRAAMGAKGLARSAQFQWETTTDRVASQLGL